MNTYTVRIELHSKNEFDFTTLHNAMEAEGFIKTIKSDDGKEYVLPRGEYNISTNHIRKVVLDTAKRAANTTGKTFEILVTESKGRTWSGLTIKK